MATITWVLTAVVTAFVLLSGIFKIAGNKKVTDTIGKIGMGRYIVPLGIAEIIFALLFIYPPTRNVGFILLGCYFSGALATDLSHKNAIAAPIVFLTLLFITEFLYNPAFFLK